MDWQSQVPETARDAVATALETGEQVQWVGQPMPRYFSREVFKSMAFGVVFAVFTAGWFIQVVCNRQDGPAAATGGFFAVLLFGLGCAAASVGCLLSPLWEQRRWRRRVYLVTDRRMIAFQGRRAKTLRRFEAEPVGRIHRFVHRDGSEDLLIEAGVSTEYDAWSECNAMGFERIRDADVVEALLPRLEREYETIPTVDHPTQDRPAIIGFRIALAIIALVAMPLFLVGYPWIAAPVFFGAVITVIVQAFRLGRKSVCPRCGEALPRDAHTPRGTYYFTCARCRVRWASRIVTT